MEEKFFEEFSNRFCQSSSHAFAVLLAVIPEAYTVSFNICQTNI